MFDKLEALEERFQLVSEKISDPDIIADQESWRKYCKEHSDLTPIIDKYRELKSAKQTVADDKEMLDAGQDKEFEEMIRLEMAEAEETIERASEELKILLLPKDPNDEKNVIMEIRGGTGGDEAALFAATHLPTHQNFPVRQPQPESEKKSLPSLRRLPCREVRGGSGRFGG